MRKRHACTSCISAQSIVSPPIDKFSMLLPALPLSHHASLHTRMGASCMTMSPCFPAASSALRWVVQTGHGNGPQRSSAVPYSPGAVLSSATVRRIVPGCTSQGRDRPQYRERDGTPVTQHGSNAPPPPLCVPCLHRRLLWPHIAEGPCLQRAHRVLACMVGMHTHVFIGTCLAWWLACIKSLIIPPFWIWVGATVWCIQ